MRHLIESLEGQVDQDVYENGLMSSLLCLLEQKVPPAGVGVPKNVYLRAGRRWLDALARGGFESAVRATEIRIGKITAGSEKLRGIMEYLKAWLKEEKPKGGQKSEVNRLIGLAQARAHA